MYLEQEHQRHLEQQTKFMDHQKKLEEQHRMYLEQQQKYYEEHHKFLEQQQTYKPPPVVYQAPPVYVPPPNYYRGPAYAGKSHSKSPTRNRVNTVPSAGAPQIAVGELGNGPNVSSGGMYTSRNQQVADGDAFETTSKISRGSKNSRLRGVKGLRDTSQSQGWNTHTNKVVSAEEEQMKLMAQERRKAYDQSLKSKK